MAINEHDVFYYEPDTGRLAQELEKGLETDQIELYYNEDCDTLLIYLRQEFKLTVSVDMDGLIYFLVDPESHDVVGYQIDDFMHVAVVEEPKLLELAWLVGISDTEIAAARKRIGDRRMRGAVVHKVLRDLLDRNSS